MSVHRAARVVAAVALVPALLAGCGGSDEGSGGSSTAGSSASAGGGEQESETASAAASESAPASEPGASGAQEGEPTSVFDLAVGDCFQDPSDQAVQDGIRELPVVPCDTPHDNEVFAVVTLPDGEYPGPEQLQATAEEECVASFEGYVGVPFEQSQFSGFPIPPSQESWEGGDRELLCTLFVPGEQTTGSAQGSAR